MKNTSTYDLSLHIEGCFLRQIYEGEKTIEYRDIKPFYDQRLSGRKVPFLLRLINGMSVDAPEIIIEVLRIRKDKRTSRYREHGVYCLYLGKITNTRHINKLIKLKDC